MTAKYIMPADHIPDPDIDDVLREQFEELLLAPHRPTASARDYGRYARMRGILMEPFERPAENARTMAAGAAPKACTIYKDDALRRKANPNYPFRNQ